ncbi:MAG TPA: phage tail fiber protein, partial [Cytophagaceae bacterium]
MTYSYITYIGDGDTRLFGIPFPYLKKEHVKVYINNVPYTDFIWSTDSTLEFASAPADGAIVRIQRETPYSAGMVKYTTSNILNPDNLNLTTNQLLYALQEAMDRLTTTIAIDNDNKYDAQNKVIKNVADPIDPTDAVNKRYIQPAVDQANASAMAAKTSETNAKVSELRASTAANNAKNSETNAALSASIAKAYSD